MIKFNFMMWKPLSPYCCYIFSCFFFQMFSRISVALAETDAVTLTDLLRVIQKAYSRTPVTCSVENIYDAKTWLREYTAKFQHHSHPHGFRFKLNENGEVEMTYRLWAKVSRKEWYPEEGPFIVLSEVPPGKPAILKPDLKKCPSVKTMRDSIEKLKVRMSVNERDWWEKRIEKEEEHVKLWESLSEDDYRKPAKRKAPYPLPGQRGKPRKEEKQIKTAKNKKTKQKQSKLKTSNSG